MLTLRPYQLGAIDQLRASYLAGHRAPCLVLPTGGGKTAIASEVIRSSTSRGNRVLFLAHRTELLDQSVAKLEINGITHVRLIRAATDLGSPTAPVVVASVQTLTRWGDRMPPADLVVFDEAHHTIARTWARIADRYSAARLLGLTATPQRADGRPLGDIFDDLVVAASVRELTKLEHLVPCIVMRPDDRLDPGQVAQSPAEAYAAHGQDGRAVVFCGTVARAREVAASMAVPAEVVHGQMSADNRADVLSRFRSGALRVVANVYVLTEGWDDPGASVCILERNPGHAGVYLQMVGRVLRPAPGKTHAILLDLAGCSHKHGMPDADRKYTLDGRGISLVERQPVVQCPECGAAFSPGPTHCPQCGVELPKRRPVELEVLGVPLTEASKQPPRPPPTIAITSKYPGYCRLCNGAIRVGDRIFWTKGKKPRHAACGLDAAMAAANRIMRDAG